MENPNLFREGGPENATRGAGPAAARRVARAGAADLRNRGRGARRLHGRPHAALRPAARAADRPPRRPRRPRARAQRVRARSHRYRPTPTRPPPRVSEAILGPRAAPQPALGSRARARAGLGAVAVLPGRAASRPARRAALRWASGCSAATRGGSTTPRPWRRWARPPAKESLSLRATLILYVKRSGWPEDHLPPPTA